MNDMIVDNMMPKLSKSIFNLSSSIRVVKTTKKTAMKNQPPSRFTRNKPWISQPKCNSTFLGEPLNMVHRTLVQNHNRNPDHQEFKDSFPPHGKSELSKSKGTNDVVNYTYDISDTVTNEIEPVDIEYCDMIISLGSEDAPKPKAPFVLRGLAPPSCNPTPSLACLNAISRSFVKIFLKGPEPSTFRPKLSMDKALTKENVPKDLNLDQFQSMVGHLTSPHHFPFFEEDDHSLSHNAPLLTCNMLLECSDSLALTNKEFTKFYNAKLKEIEKTLQIKDIGMGEY